MKNTKSIISLLIVNIILVGLLAWYDQIFSSVIGGTMFSLVIIGLLALFLITNILFFISLTDQRQWKAETFFLFFTFIISLLFMLIRAFIAPGWLLVSIGEGLLLLLLVGILVVIGSIKPKRKARKHKKPQSYAKEIHENKEDEEEIKAELKKIKSQLKPKTQKAASKKRSTQLLVGSQFSDKVHDPHCMVIKRIEKKDRISFKNKGEATRKGYIPCGLCKPF